MDLDFTSLYIRDNKGAIRIWSIGSDGSEIIIRHGQLGGAMQEQREDVPRGKASRTLDEQIMSRIASRIHKQRDKGYSPNLKDAEMPAINSLGLKKPMLAQPIKKVKNIDLTNAFVQPKLDGNRMLVANIDGELIAYSRNGKRMPYLDHILNGMYIPEGAVIDGEIYCHGESLQTIVSWVKREQENTKRLRYHAYDLISHASFPERNYALNSLDLGDFVDKVPTIKVATMEYTMYLFKQYRAEGYEGAILRTDGAAYEDGKRSKSLIKIKEWFDEEYVVTGIRPSADGWAVLTCELPNSKTFGVSAPGDMYEKQMPIDDPQFYLGRKVRVEYSQITKDGIPFHPIATEWRDKELE